MSQPVLPKGWEEVALHQIAEVRLGRQRSPALASAGSRSVYGAVYEGGECDMGWN